MSTKVLICDDSSMARRQMARSLPASWPVEITFAANGREGLSAIREGKGEFVFLDLNMPVMDGYKVLETLAAEGIETRVVVVSGDIQPEARRRVMQLGALEFIKKPVDVVKIAELFGNLHLQRPPERRRDTRRVRPPPAGTRRPPAKLSPEQRDCYREIANVAMGQAASLLARVWDVFVLLPIPHVNMIEISELQMALKATEYDTVSTVCQGFIGSGIAGEAVLFFHDFTFADIARLMKYEGKIDKATEMELLMDVAGILIGACLKGIAEQFDVPFGLGHPAVLGQHVPLEGLLTDGVAWRETLAIEITYTIENYNVQCDLLILFTEESLDIMSHKIAYLLD
ncbi:response regulator [Exilibacterium tricleocarpae]|uniref:Response regulator n=1 Tax=Exilibacterium tricleocarpae TaxID=2591008 RepID=A0A545T1S5_9GAMM|nr:response regulator [Exilibacterium tricleocarpae]